MTPDIRKERETALYEAALRLIAKGVNPAAMKVQQIADEAGIGKGTVYEYFASKDEILQGMALYCFDTEIARIAVLMEPCTTLQELEDAVMAYLQDLSGNRMGTYQVIASSIGARENLRGMDECVQALRGVLHRTMAALRQKGEINPALPASSLLIACFVIPKTVIGFSASANISSATLISKLQNESYNNIAVFFISIVSSHFSICKIH